MKNDGVVLGTGGYKDNHITRVYVKPAFQKPGYGSYIMQCLENQIGLKYDKIYLEASLPARYLYEKRGYRTMKCEKLTVKNNVILEYEIMEKCKHDLQREFYIEGKTKKILSKYHIFKDRYFYDECVSICHIAYMYSISQCVIHHYTYIKGYINKMLPIFIKCQMRICISIKEKERSYDDIRKY